MRGKGLDRLASLATANPLPPCPGWATRPQMDIAGLAPTQYTQSSPAVIWCWPSHTTSCSSKVKQQQANIGDRTEGWNRLGEVGSLSKLNEEKRRGGGGGRRRRRGRRGRRKELDLYANLLLKIQNSLQFPSLQRALREQLWQNCDWLKVTKLPHVEQSMPFFNQYTILALW